MGSLSRLESPSDLEARDRLAIDLIDGHIARAARIAAIIAPVRARLGRRCVLGNFGRYGGLALAKGARNGDGHNQ